MYYLLLRYSSSHALPCRWLRNPILLCILSPGPSYSFLCPVFYVVTTITCCFSFALAEKLKIKLDFHEIGNIRGFAFGEYAEMRCFKACDD